MIMAKKKATHWPHGLHWWLQLFEPTLKQVGHRETSRWKHTLQTQKRERKKIYPLLSPKRPHYISGAWKWLSLYASPFRPSLCHTHREHSMSGLIKDSNSLPPSVHASALLPVCLFCLGVFVFNMSQWFFFLNHKSSQCLPSLAPPKKGNVWQDVTSQIILIQKSALDGFPMFSPQVAPVCMDKLQLHHVLIQYFIFNVAENAHLMLLSTLCHNTLCLCIQ